MYLLNDINKDNSVITQVRILKLRPHVRISTPKRGVTHFFSIFYFLQFVNIIFIRIVFIEQKN